LSISDLLINLNFEYYKMSQNSHSGDATDDSHGVYPVKQDSGGVCRCMEALMRIIFKAKSREN
jgi:hypothetical protein